MLILNHSVVSPLEICVVDSLQDIQDSLPSAFLILRGDLKIAQFCYQNGIDYASVIQNIKEALLVVNLGGKFFICEYLEMAKELQNLAENYLFDAKVLLCIKEEEEMLEIAKLGIDGVIFWKN